jgi:peroxiredoxin
VNRQWIALVAVALAAASGGYFVAKQMSPDTGRSVQANNTGTAQVMGRERPDFTHPDPDGRMVSAADFDGQVLLVNFWATWCKPCVDEMPMLSQLQDELGDRGFRVAGIALDDPVRAAAFAEDMGLSYPILVGGADVVVTGRRYGNTTGMLPYSVLIDTQGVVRWTKLGALEKEELERQVHDLLPTGR